MNNNCVASWISFNVITLYLDFLQYCYQVSFKYAYNKKCYNMTDQESFKIRDEIESLQIYGYCLEKISFFVFFSLVYIYIIVNVGKNSSDI